MYKSEEDIMEELYESIYSGEVAGINDDEDEDKKDNEDDTDSSSDSDTSNNDSDSNDDEKSDDSDNEESSSDDSSDEESDDSSDESDDSDDDNESEETEITQDSQISSELKGLKDQYNDVLVRAFEQYAPESIREALEEFDAGFGENIEVILDNAWNKLRDRILKDMGVDEPADTNQVDVIHPSAMGGGFDPVAALGHPVEVEIAQ